MLNLSFCSACVPSVASTPSRQWAVEQSPNLRKQIQVTFQVYAFPYVYLKELIETEDRFGEDMLNVRNVFMKQLITVVGSEGIEKIFLNWVSRVRGC